MAITTKSSTKVKPAERFIFTFPTRQPTAPKYSGDEGPPR